MESGTETYVGLKSVQMRQNKRERIDMRGMKASASDWEESRAGLNVRIRTDTSSKMGKDQ